MGEIAGSPVRLPANPSDAGVRCTARGFRGARAPWHAGPVDVTQARLFVVAGLVWLDDARLLVQRRGPQARFGAGMLELPGGKLEPGEAPTTGLRRELVEEWGPAAAQLRVGAVLELLHHVYPPPGPEVLMAVYDVDARAWGQRWRELAVPEPGATLEVHAAAALPVEAFLPADREFIAGVRARADR